MLIYLPHVTLLVLSRLMVVVGPPSTVASVQVLQQQHEQQGECMNWHYVERYPMYKLGCMQILNPNIYFLTVSVK